MFTIVTNIFPPKGIMQRNKKKFFDLFFSRLQIITLYIIVINFFPEFFSLIWMSVEFIITTNTKKITTRCVPWYIYFLPERKNCRFEWHYFPDFSKMEKKSFKKNDLPFHKKPKLSGINSPKQHGIIHINNKKPWEIIPSP